MPHVVHVHVPELEWDLYLYLWERTDFAFPLVLALGLVQQLQEGCVLVLCYVV